MAFLIRPVCRQSATEITIPRGISRQIRRGFKPSTGGSSRQSLRYRRMNLSEKRIRYDQRKNGADRPGTTRNRLLSLTRVRRSYRDRAVCQTKSSLFVVSGPQSVFNSREIPLDRFQNWSLLCRAMSKKCGRLPDQTISHGECRIDFQNDHDAAPDTEIQPPAQLCQRAVMHREGFGCVAAPGIGSPQARVASNRRNSFVRPGEDRPLLRLRSGSAAWLVSSSSSRCCCSCQRFVFCPRNVACEV